jgi:hypothetical protein
VLTPWQKPVLVCCINSRRRCRAADATAALPWPPPPCCHHCRRRRANAVAAAAGHTCPVGIGKDGGHGGWLVLGVERWCCGLLGYKKQKRRRQKSCLWTGLIHRGNEGTKSGYKKTNNVQKNLACGQGLRPSFGTKYFVP